MDLFNTLFYFPSDYEHILVLFVLTLLFVVSLKKRSDNIDRLYLDKSYTQVLRGIACVFILMGHYESSVHFGLDYYPKGIGWFVRETTANIALAWFMFISGYGLTVSKSNIQHHLIACIKRCGKVFLPMFYVLMFSFVLYAVLPSKNGIDCIGDTVIPEELFMFTGEKSWDLSVLLNSPFEWYWYIWCILIFYCLFYISDYLSQKFGVLSTYFLLAFLTIYYILAFLILGPDLAHYYRLTWAFLFGHLFARWNALPTISKLLCLMVGLASFAQEGKLMILSFLLSVVGIYVCCLANKRYAINDKCKPLLTLGSISYFFYLIHRRVTWVLCCYVSVYDLCFWILVTTIISYLFYKLYSLYGIPKYLK